MRFQYTDIILPKKKSIAFRLRRLSSTDCQIMVSMLNMLRSALRSINTIVQQQRNEKAGGSGFIFFGGLLDIIYCCIGITGLMEILVSRLEEMLDNWISRKSQKMQIRLRKKTEKEHIENGNLLKIPELKPSLKL